MSNDTKPNEQLELLKKEKDIVVANNEREGFAGVMAIKAHSATLKKIVSLSVAKAFVSMGRAVVPTDIDFIIDGLCSEIKRAFPGIRLEEIGLAIHKFSMGEVLPINKIFKLCLADFVLAIRTYMHSDARLLAFKEYNQKLNLLESPTKPSDDDQKKTKIQNALNAFEFFKLNHFYNDYGNSIFDYLVDIGVIKTFSEKQKVMIFRSAKKKVISDLHSNKRSIDLRNESNRIIKEVHDNKDHPRIYTEAKKIALKIVFDKMISKGVELKDLIK